MASKQEGKSVLKEFEGNSLPDDLINNLKSLNFEEKDVSSKEKDNDFIPDWLKECEYPFLWHSQEKRGLGPRQIIEKTLQKIDELKMDEDEFTLQNFILLLKLVLEYSLLGEMEMAREHMDTVEKSFEEATKDSKDSECGKLKMSMGHLMSSTKAHFLLLSGEEEMSRRIGKNIIPVKVMPDHEKAGMWALKARFFLYSGYELEGVKGVECGRKALELDPGNPEWEYLLAKLLRSQRRENFFSMEIPREELELLEKAVERCKNTKYLVYLAQVYRECGSQAFKQYRNKPDFYKSPLRQSINDMHQKALNLYKDALELNENSPSTLRRVGYGVMNLPRHMTDYNLAQECLEKSLALTYSLITVHMLGTFYHRYGNNNEKALRCFEETVIAQSHAGLSDMIRLKYQLDPKYDPVEDLDSGLKWEQKQCNRNLLLAQLGGYYLFIKRDFFKSLEYFNQIIDEDPESSQMKTFKSFFLQMTEPINLFQYLVNEALLVISKSQADSSVSEEEETEITTEQEIGYVEDLLCKISEIHPAFMEMTPDEALIDRLIEASKELGNSRFKKQRDNFKPGEHRNNFGSGNRGGFRPYRGRGGNRGRGGRGNWNSDREGNERRGRFPVDNSNLENTNSEDNLERRGRFSVQNQRQKQNQETRTNWRQADSKRQDDKEHRPEDSEKNWRKK